MFISKLQIKNAPLLFVKNNFYIKCILTVFATLAFYWQDLVLVLNEAIKYEASSHILAIPFLFAYLLYRLRKMMYVTAQYTDPYLNKYYYRDEILGFLLCIFAYVIKIYGSYTFYSLEIHLTSMPIFIAGIILLIFNKDTLRAISVPILFLYFLVPIPLDILQSFGTILSIFSSKAAFYIVKNIGLPVDFIEMAGNPTILLDTSNGTIPFVVDIACSGLYSLTGFLLFSVFVAYISRGIIISKVFMVLLGFPIIYLMNIIRIVLVVLIGYSFGLNYALDIFHLMGGWILIFIGTLIIMIISERYLNVSFFKRDAHICHHHTLSLNSEHCLDCGREFGLHPVSLTKHALLKYFLIIIVLISLIVFEPPVITITKSADEDILSRSSGRYEDINVLPDIGGGYRVTFMFRDENFENLSGQDASIFYGYVPTINVTDPIIWVGLEIGSTKGCLHPWEVCLITFRELQGWAPIVQKYSLRDVHILENPPLSARYFSFYNTRDNTSQVILYWYTRSGFQTENGFSEKWVKLSLIQYIESEDEVESVEQKLLPIAEKIAHHWNPVSEWSGMLLFIVKNSYVFIPLIISMCALLVIMYFHSIKKQKLNAKEIFTKITFFDDRMILKALKETNEMPYEVNIALNYKNITGKDIDLNILNTKIIEAEKIGLVKRKIFNINAEPYCGWISLY